MYVLHYRNLQLYTNLGLKVKKVHSVRIQSVALVKTMYVDFNTQKRTQGKISFEKDFFKLMNNLVFGKTMDSLRKGVDVKLVADEKKLMKLTSKSTFVTSKIFNKNW